MQQLNHENVVGYLGSEYNGDMFYMMLELADNGELSDRIEPHIGMSQREAFRQLLMTSFPSKKIPLPLAHVI